jgi:hypothetical protein
VKGVPSGAGTKLVNWRDMSDNYVRASHCANHSFGILSMQGHSYLYTTVTNLDEAICGSRKDIHTTSVFAISIARGAFPSHDWKVFGRIFGPEFLVVGVNVKGYNTPGR